MVDINNLLEPYINTSTEHSFGLYEIILVGQFLLCIIGLVLLFKGKQKHIKVIGAFLVFISIIFMATAIIGGYLW